jgi:hypothetical protein
MNPNDHLPSRVQTAAPAPQAIRNWAAAIERGAGITTETDLEMLYVSQVRRYVRDLGPPPRQNGAAQAAWSDVCAALYG